jgi:phytoene synthase
MSGTRAAAPSAEEITRASKSNLALAFIALPRERRGDISVFYAYCRIIDDLADEPGLETAERTESFVRWRAALRGPTDADPALAPQVRALMAKYRLPVEHFEEIVAGCEMDVAGTEYRTWEELRLYCYRVASVVGLISIEIFGYRNPACREYAVQLGLALQVTNIIRDVGEDWRREGRLYLPRDEMERFGYSPEALAKGEENEALRALLEHQAQRADGLYAAAIAALPREDRRSMSAAEIMRTVYSRLLRKMERGGFRVLGRRYRLSRVEKLWCIAKVLLRR